MDHQGARLKKMHIGNVVSLHHFKLFRSYSINAEPLARLQINEIVYATRNAERWSVSRSRTNFGKQMLRYRLASLLNILENKGIDMKTIPVRVTMFDEKGSAHSFSRRLTVLWRCVHALRRAFSLKAACIIFA